VITGGLADRGRGQPQPGQDRHVVRFRIPGHGLARRLRGPQRLQPPARIAAPGFQVGGAGHAQCRPVHVVPLLAGFHGPAVAVSRVSRAVVQGPPHPGVAEVPFPGLRVRGAAGLQLGALGPGRGLVACHPGGAQLGPDVHGRAPGFPRVHLPAHLQLIV
jgi:hypothetical protein